MKSVRAIAVDEVALKFTDRRLKKLAHDAKLPAIGDFGRFARSVRGDVTAYVQASRVPSSNDLHREIKALYRAANRKEYELVAVLLERLPAAARDWLDERGRRAGWQSIYGSPGVNLPTANDLREPAHRIQACTLVRQLCTDGGGMIEGRLRPTGKRSRTYRPLLCAPKPTRHFAKREAEFNLVISLQISFLEATGRMPPLTARHGFLGPFARMTQKVLNLAGARADAVGLINELSKRRREQERRAPKRALSDGHPVT